MSEYVLKSGEGAVDRLDAVDDMFGQASREFLLAAGLQRGARVLDVGCGTGNVTTWMAVVAGTAGRVLGVDAQPEQLQVARAAALRAGINNIEFVKADVESDEFSFQGYDLVHCRLVLMHLKHPERALDAMVRAVRPGGLLVCEETSASSVFTTGANASVIGRMNELFIKLGQARGLDFDIGERLFALLSNRSSKIVASRFVQPMLPMSAAKRFLRLAASEVRPVLLGTGLASAQEADALSSALEAIPEDASAFYAPGRLSQVAGVVG